jgi:hypothetical protein
MAYSFNRSTPDYATYGHVSALDGLGKLTIALIVKRPASVNSYDSIFGQIGANTTGTGTASGFTLVHNNTSTSNLILAVRNNNSGPSFIGNGVLASAGTWYALWIVYDGSLGTAQDRIKMWANGSAVTNDTVNGDYPATIGTCDQALIFGSDTGALSAQAWGGTLAAFAMFPGVAITDSTLISDHAALTGPLPDLSSASAYVADLDYYAELSSTLDFGTGGLTATVTGSPSTATHPYTVSGATRFWRDRKRTYLSPWLRR